MSDQDLSKKGLSEKSGTKSESAVKKEGKESLIDKKPSNWLLSGITAGLVLLLAVFLLLRKRKINA